VAAPRSPDYAERGARPRLTPAPLPPEREPIARLVDSGEPGLTEVRFGAEPPSPTEVAAYAAQLGLAHGGAAELTSAASESEPGSTLARLLAAAGRGEPVDADELAATSALVLVRRLAERVRAGPPYTNLPPEEAPSYVRARLDAIQPPRGATAAEGGLLGGPYADGWTRGRSFWAANSPAKWIEQRTRRERDRDRSRMPRVHDALADPSADPQDQAALREARERLRAAVAALPADERTFVERLLAGASRTDAAAAAWPASSPAARSKRAYRLMRDVLPQRPSLRRAAEALGHTEAERE